MKFKVIVWEDEEDEGYVIECPALPGCVSQGDTIEEVLENIKDAIQGWLEVAAERGKTETKISSAREIEVEA
ncbi:MAG: type II toxin-antitoxin system HicB family antitoxin [Methanosarcinales archaeon Met12]|nr:MAG: type II toxin-antitoxin system HicB family antitoxin [Methanosarcinales archaeon Met12]